MLDQNQSTLRSIAIPQLNINTYLRPIAAIVVLLTILLTGNFASAQEEDDACIVSTEEDRTARVRVGPGEHRTSITFLVADTEYTVLGRFENDDGEIWFRLDKDEAAPNRAINEAWVFSEDVDTNGDCKTVDESAEPIIIPIVNSQPVNTDDSDSDTEESVSESTAAEDERIVLNEGLWTVNYAAITNASCAGGGNVQFTTLEWFGFQPGFSDVLTLTATGFTHGGVDFTYIGDNTYHGNFTDGGLTGTVYLTATSSNTLVGRYIDSANDCSGTTNITVTH